ncbi:MAG: hypothetical protein HFJ45_10140 [Clostridia bacterium]|nr:hypothetical protein [Clostridia bacterium]
MIYGPLDFFRNWFITTAMNTMNHKYLATCFYDTETISYYLTKNSISDFGIVTNTNEINFIDYSSFR